MSSLSHTHTLCKCVSVCLYNAIMLFVCVSVRVCLSLSLCINVYIHTLHMGEERDCMINDQPDIKKLPSKDSPLEFSVLMNYDEVDSLHVNRRPTDFRGGTRR